MSKLGAAPAGVYSDDGSKLLALQSPDGGQIMVSNMMGRRLPTRIGVIGDSILALCANNSATDNIANIEGITTRFNSLRNGAHIIVNNEMNGTAQAGTTAFNALQINSSGVAGALQAFKQMIDRPKEVLVCYGANDFFLPGSAGASNTMTAAMVLADMKYLLSELAEMGVRGDVINGFPCSGQAGGPGNIWTLARQQEQWKYMAALPALIAAFPMHMLLDMYSLGSDNGTITGMPLSSMLIDGVHPNSAGAIIWANGLHVQLPPSEGGFAPYIQQPGDTQGTGYANSQNILSLSEMTNLTAGATGLPANFVEVTLSNCSATYLVVSDSDGDAYNTLQATITFTAAGIYWLELWENVFPQPQDRWVSSCIVSLLSDPNGVCIQCGSRGKVYTSSGNAQVAWSQYLQRPTAVAPGVLTPIKPFSNQLQISGLANPLGNATPIRTGVGLVVQSSGAGVVTVNLAEPSVFRVSQESLVPQPYTPGASPFTYKNNTNNLQQVVVTGGTISAANYSRNNGTTNISVTVPGQILLAPGDTLTLTYTVAPTGFTVIEMT